VSHILHPDGPTRRIQRVRRAKWAVLIGWIVMFILMVPFIGRLNDRLDNSNTLPAGSQAQKVIDLQRRADPTAQEGDLEVVYERSGGLTSGDKQAIATQHGHVAAATIEHATGVGPVTYSPDGQAAYFTLRAKVPNNNTTGPEIETDIVTKVRQMVGSSAGLTTVTTGSMAFDVDGNSMNTDQLLLISAAIIVAFLLVLTYRSALLWMVPLFSAVLAISLTDAIVYFLIGQGLHVSSLDSSIAIVLVFGVATDYGMLLISRYREYLYTHADKNEAVALALKGSFGAITASAATVALALLALTFAEFDATQGLGPVAAVGVASAFVVQMTFLPAVLAIGGRVLLWPRAPKFTPAGEGTTNSHMWTSVSRTISRHPHRITVGMTLLLLVGAIGLTQLNLTVNPTTGLRGDPPSVQGQSILQKHFAELSDAPVVVVADSRASILQAQRIAQQESATGTISAISDLAGHPTISIAPKSVPYSDAAFSYIAALRTEYARAGLRDVLVGGDQAAQLDYTTTTRRDNVVLIPIILVIVTLILGLLLRAVVAPIMILVTVLLSFGASFGLSVLIFRHLFHFQSIDPVLPIYIFLFVVALGVDYNIFLMDRARQETASRGVREGVLHSLSVTGGVITAAGLVLAGTFAVLAQIPIVSTTVVGVSVALGVLIDSFLVRSFLLPALVLTVGPKTWWPSRLSTSGRAPWGWAHRPARAPGDRWWSLAGAHRWPSTARARDASHAHRLPDGDVPNP
jgi:putative drug exporter of the RND superfamily